MRPDDRRDQRYAGHREGQGGIPDGLLIALLGFLLGMTALVWTATGLAGTLAHGSWPAGVTFTRTPLALPSLVARPQDIPAAWPDTPDGQLSGYGLFWGLFIGQLMVLIVLTVFVMGTFTRWRAVRAARRDAQGRDAQAGPGAAQPPTGEASRTTAPSPAPRAEPARLTKTDRPESPVPEQALTPAQPTPRTTPPAHTDVGPHTDATSRTDAENRTGVEHAHQAAPPAVALAPPRGEVPAPRTEQVPSAPGQPADARPAAPAPGRATVVVAPRETRHLTAGQAVRDAEGAVVVVTSHPPLWQETKDARAKLGPVLLYDPAHLCDTPARMHWSPIAGCEDRQRAAQRSAALLAPVRPSARLDAAMADTAETLLRSYLHAAAVDGRTVRHVHRWSQGTQIQDAVRVLRTNPKAAPGSAGELEAALTAHPERRDMAQELTTRALSALSMVNIREACTPHRTDALTLDSFVHEGGTLYVVGESIEDPRTNPRAMPFLTALVSSVVERGRHMAERSSSGRLDPPMTLVLDDVAAVAPLPQLPELLATGADRGMPALALLRSREQARSRWPHDELPL